MKRWLLFLTTFTALLLSIHIAHVQAANPAPIQITPLNGQIVSTVRLEWLVPDYLLKTTTPYRVQIASNPSFQSTEKDYYTQNTYYSPSTLEEGIWYWRVLAKDINGTDSVWTEGLQFTYSTILLPSPSPSSVATTSPSPLASPFASISPSPLPVVVSPSPSSIPSPFPTPTPSPYFNFSGLPSQISSTESFQLVISLYLPQSPQTVFYLKGAFFEDGSSNYFGQTKYVGNWVKNSQTYSSQYKIQTDFQGKWQGTIEFISDPQDSGFSSSGDYSFKVARYSATGSGPTWSDTQTIYINEIISSPSPSPSVSPSPSLTPKPSFYPSPEIFTSDETESTISSQEASSSALNIDPQIASIEGVATVASQIATKSSSLVSNTINPGWFYISSGVLFIAGIASAFIVKYKPHLKIKQWLFKHPTQTEPSNLQPLWQDNLNQKVE